MKLEINSEKIRKLLGKAYKGVSNNKLAPITSLMGLEFSPTALVIRTYDGENYVVVADTDIQYPEDVSITVNANIFKQLIDKVTTKVITLEVKDRFLEVTANGVYKIEIVYDDNRVLAMKKVEKDLEGAKEATIKKQILLDAIAYNEAAAAKTTEVLFEMGAHFSDRIITTDEVLATITNRQLLPNGSFLFKFNTLHLVDIFDEENLTFLYSGKDFIIKDGLHLIRGSFLDGLEEYPAKEVMAWVSGDPGKSTPVNTKLLIESLDRLSIFVTPYDNDAVEFEFVGKELLIRSALSKAVEHLELSEVIPNPCKLSLSLTPLRLQLGSATSETVKLFYENVQSLHIASDVADYLIAAVQGDSDDSDIASESITV